MVSRLSSAKRRVLREISAERRAETVGVDGAMGACVLVSTNVSATRRPVACSRACQNRAPDTAP